MHRLLLLLALALLAGAGFLTQHISSSAATAPEGKGPVVVELFTSEGCSSCPPADALLQELDGEGRLEGVEVIALGWHVDYWDRLGWKDRFSAPSHTGRQQDYADSFGSDQVYTPQMVVDGRVEFVGSSRQKARTAILNASATAKVPVDLQVGSVSDESVSFDVNFSLPSGSGRARVLLAITESGLVSAVGAGENRGETIRHGAVVRTVKRLDPASAGQEYRQSVRVALDKSWKPQHLRGVLLVQDERTRAVIGAARIRLR